MLDFWELQAAAAARQQFALSHGSILVGRSAYSALADAFYQQFALSSVPLGVDKDF